MGLGHAQQSRVDSKLRKVSTKLEWMLGFLLMLEIGTEATVGGWIPTFAILAGVSEKEGATVYVTIFWVSMTVMRFAYAYLPGTSSQKMKRSQEMIVATSLGLLLLIYAGWIRFACLAGCILFGVAMAPMYALVYSLPSEFGFRLAESQTSTIVVCSEFAEGTLTSPTGKLMEWGSYRMLLYSEIFMALSMWLLRNRVVAEFKSLSESGGAELEVELTEVKKEQPG